MPRILFLLPLTLIWGSSASADTPPAPRPSAKVKTTSKAKAASRGAPAKPPVSDEKLKPFKEAMEALDAAKDAKDMVAAMTVIREGFPTSRPVVAQSAVKGSPKLRAFAVQVLGELGDARSDLETVTAALADDNSKVRLAAVMACRRLGKESCPALAAHLPREQEANNRKMTVKALQHWEYREAVPLLVQTLKSEKEKSVRNFIVTALESLTGQKRGDELAAWEAYLESQAASEQAKEIVKDSEAKLTGAKP